LGGRQVPYGVPPPDPGGTEVGLTESRRAGWALALTSVAFFMVTLDTLVVIAALPAISHDLKAGMSTLEWTVNAYGLTTAAGILTAAALGDRYGRRRVFAAGLALFTTASAACALAPSAEMLIAARAVQGLGAAIVMPLSLTILTGVFPAERRGAVVGIWGGIAGVAVASGALIGGSVTQGLNWHWIFWVNVPIGLVATVLAVLRLAESYGPATRLDLPAVALVSGGATSLVWALVRANQIGWGSPATIAGLGAGIGLIAAFVAWERRVAAPMLPPRLFANRSFTAANVTGFLMTAALMAAVFLTAQYFQVVLGYSPVMTGLRLLPWTATPLLVAPAAGALSDRIGARPVMATGMLLQGAGLAWFGLVATAQVGYGQLVLPLIVAGIGVSMALPTIPATVMSAVAPADMGKASGTSNTLQRFGGAFGIAVATAVFAANGHLGSPASFAAGFRPAAAFAATLSMLGAISALSVSQRRRQPAAIHPAPLSSVTADSVGVR
jgi:EmrB/QacA subfamily drug resistance transporter